MWIFYIRLPYMSCFIFDPHFKLSRIKLFRNCSHITFATTQNTVLYLLFCMILLTVVSQHALFLEQLEAEQASCLTCKEINIFPVLTPLDCKQCYKHFNADKFSWNNEYEQTRRQLFESWSLSFLVSSQKS